MIFTKLTPDNASDLFKNSREKLYYLFRGDNEERKMFIEVVLSSN